MNLQNPTILIPVISVLLLLVGYALRAQRWAPYVMLVGAFGTMGSLVYHVARAIG
ncbi:putative Tic20 family protein [Herbaspirillum sp. Sphag1AN]|jgi:hypothetical protein|uniref:hypothetical protein n=1 Tax=unclassified Herbaspirillum TaxID=2624150 RepID=UPI00162245D5|nr:MULTISPECIES: hypothetical protein [unclassified Herbaspirillum]MBB3212187.1 putative Tic20 family protein [Herbaspirillum sp. Sphag1AN]MBB3243979.1 putative Tic20 family protein [Herbaspirillum sp. Sphag64]